MIAYHSAGQAMLFIYTTSYDTTVDLLLHRMGGEGCFRFNFDLWRDYKLEVTWDGRDSHGNRAPMGVYFARMEALGEVRVRKVIALR